MTSNPHVHELWEHAKAKYGQTFITHFLDLPPGKQPEPNDSQRLVALNVFDNLFVDSELTPDDRVSIRAKVLIRLLDDEGYTWFERVRKSVNGRLPVKTGDALTDSLSRLVFNALLLEYTPNAEEDRFSIAASFSDSQLCTHVASAFLADPDLTSLFPGASSQPDAKGQIQATSLITWLPGGGGTTHLTILIGNMVEQTLARMRFQNALREEHIVDFVRETLDQVRHFARGEEVDILVLTGLNGVSTTDAINRETWGLRPSTGLAISDIPGPGHARPKSVLWTTVPHRLLSCHRADIDEKQASSLFESYSKLHRDFQPAFTRRIMTLQFGLLAWSINRPEGQTVNVQASSPWSLFPVTMAQPPWVDETTIRLGETVLDASDLVVIADIVDEVGDANPKLDISLKRMIRIASERRDPADALIDAVIAWENMLGSKSETTFKVCASLACLLEPDHEERRLKLFAKANEIYNLRSALIHGTEDSDTDSANKLAQEALLLAVRAFRRINSDSKLAEMRSSSRAKTVLLGPKT